MNIPYVFIAGTTAKSLEVNANFSEVKKSIDSLEDNEAIIQSSLDNKAPAGGDISVTYNVAAGMENSYNAVNMNQLENILIPLQGIISGAIINPPTEGSQVISITSGNMLDRYSRLVRTSSMQLDLQSYTLTDEYYIYAECPKGGIGNYIVETTQYYQPSEKNRAKLIGSFKKDTNNSIIYLNMIGTRVNPEEVTNVL